MIYALCGQLSPLRYTGWCVVVEVLSLCCVVYLSRIISLCICVYFQVNNGFTLFAFNWFSQGAFLFRVEGDRYFFLGTWLATSPIVTMGFSALIHINLTVTTLALTCKLQVNLFPSTSACFRNSTISTDKSIVVSY